MLNIVKDKRTEQDVITQLNKYIGSPPENSRIVTFTPAIAAWVLDTYNSNNRPKKPTNIKRYAEDMLAGSWGLTGETIKFSDGDRLADGQNRLMACIRSGEPFTSHVVFGIADGLFHVMDTGKVRTNKDVLSIAGYTNVAELASAVRWAYLITTDPMSRRSLTNDEVLAKVRGAYAGVQDSLTHGRRVYSSYSHPTGQMAALHWVFAAIDADKADTFFTAWATGNRSGKNKALGKLQDSLVRTKDVAHGRINDSIRAAMVVKAWNLFCSGRIGSKNSCLMAIGEDFPVVKGQ